MATKTTSRTAKAGFADMKKQAKAAYAKGAATLGEVKTVSQDNVAALVESGRILGLGLKLLGNGYVAEGRSAAETFNADLKSLATAKSPTDFLNLQSKILSRSFGAAFDFQSKNAEAMVKLAKDSAAPISKRVGVAVGALRKAA